MKIEFVPLNLFFFHNQHENTIDIKILQTKIEFKICFYSTNLQVEHTIQQKCL